MCLIDLSRNIHNVDDHEKVHSILINALLNQLKLTTEPESQ